MGDSTEMTIESLRARLLSERSISQSASQRADQLAQKVLELEEQLKLVTLQRKKAEKATSEVLAILENHGISDMSEVYDSSSDHEEVGNESKEVNHVRNEEVGLTISTEVRTKDESSGSDLGEFPLTGRSLSWKNCSSSPNFLENTKFLEEGRRCSSIAYNGGSSTRHRFGKSCRQMKQRKTRSADVEVKAGSLLCDTRGNIDVTNSGEASDSGTVTDKTMKAGNQIEEKEYVENFAQDSLDIERKGANDTSGVDDIERNAEMERALEHQARLIGQYEAEENAQKEWEEKFKENNCYSPESIEQGNQSDITEDRDDREESLEASGSIPLPEQGEKSRKQLVGNNKEPAPKEFTGEAVAKNLTRGFPSHQHHGNGYSHDQKHMNSTPESRNSGAGFAVPSNDNLEASINETRKQDWLEKNSFYSANEQPSQNQEAPFSSLHVGDRSSKGESSRSSVQEMTHPQTPSRLAGVLDALQQAKLSIKKELHVRGSTTGGRPVVRSAVSPVSAVTSKNFMEIPVGNAGLSRLPSSSEFGAPSKTNSSEHYADSSSSLARYYPRSATGARVDDRYMSSGYMDRNSVNSADRLPMDPFMDKGIGLPSSKFLYPSYIDLMPRMSSKDELSRPNPSLGSGMAAEDHYLDYNGRPRLDVYKR